ncbi:MAG TPA: LuxR C-terminal-related transcriptional regulator [Aldersonia sp.]
MIDVGVVGVNAMIDGVRAWDGFRLVAGAPTVAGLLSCIDGDRRPQVVLLCVPLPDRSDPAANVGTLVRERYAVIVVGARPWCPHTTETIRAGACGFITADQDVGALVHTVRIAVAIGVAGPTSSLDTVDTVIEDGPTRPHLSAREWAVLHAYTSGLTLDSAARRIGIRPATAKTYLARVKAKYEEAGRPAYTKLELATRAREDCPSPDDCPWHGGGRDLSRPPSFSRRDVSTISWPCGRRRF